MIYPRASRSAATKSACTSATASSAACSAPGRHWFFDPLGKVRVDVVSQRDPWLVAREARRDRQVGRARRTAPRSST